MQLKHHPKTPPEKLEQNVLALSNMYSMDNIKSIYASSLQPSIFKFVYWGVNYFFTLMPINLLGHDTSRLFFLFKPTSFEILER